MRIVHFTPMVPGKSGMYESTKDQIKYERKEGLDSILVDAIRHDGAGNVDDWLTTEEWKKALDCEVWVVHSNLPPPLKEYIDHTEENRKKFKIVTIMHGPVENMLLKEYLFMVKNVPEDVPAFTKLHIDAIWKYDACVVLNQHEYDISILFDENDNLIYIPNSIDLERVQDKKNNWPWNYRNRPAVISCDTPRVEKLPVHIMFAMPKILEMIPTARLNMFALPVVDIEFFRNIICRSKRMRLLLRCMENFQMQSTTLMPYIAGADIGFNSNYSGIMSRVHMEMMALGVPVVSYNGDYTRFHAKIFDIPSIAEQIKLCWEDLNCTDLRNETIEYAHEHFDRGKHVKTYIKLYENLKEEKDVRV